MIERLTSHKYQAIETRVFDEISFSVVSSAVAEAHFKQFVKSTVGFGICDNFTDRFK